MTFAVTSLPGAQPIASTSATQKHVLGTICRASDPTYGEGEFIYLQGIGSTVVGSVVHYDASYVTALDTTATAGPSRPLAVAMSANVASQYGWYQISGLATFVTSGSVSFAAGAGLGVTAGSAVAAATGSVIQSACVAAAAHSTTTVLSVLVCIDRPHNASDVS